nr:MAG TPA: hypothetical protein [Bacteriophage sp.]
MLACRLITFITFWFLLSKVNAPKLVVFKNYIIKIFHIHIHFLVNHTIYKY